MSRRVRARRPHASSIAARSPLDTWAPDRAALSRLRRRLGRTPIVLPPRDRRWRDVAPIWADCLALIRGGLPFHVVAERRYDRSADPRRLAGALARGATIYVPQAHEVLPRVARLIAAIRSRILGARPEECSFLFLVEGRRREGMGLHHDGAVDAFWLQLEGRRRVTVGPAVSRRAPQDLDSRLADRGGRGWTTFDLRPGTLFYLPPFTPHRVLCAGRSLALSLTWAAAGRARGESARIAALLSWPVASGRATPIPRPSDRLWTQIPVVVDARARSARESPSRTARAPAAQPFSLLTPDGRVALPASARGLARPLGAMSSFSRSALRGRHGGSLERLVDAGVLDTRDLPVAVVPADPATLDGWRFN